VLRFVMYIVKLGMSWYWVRGGLGTSWHGTTWLGYELTGNHLDTCLGLRILLGKH